MITNFTLTARPHHLIVTVWLQVGDDLNPLRVQGLFQRISAEDCQLLDLPWRPKHPLMPNEHQFCSPCLSVSIWLQVGDDLNPLRVQGLFQRISAEDCQLLDLPWRPEHLLMTHVPVPPVCIRPSVEMDTGAGTNEDDLTIKLQASLRKHSHPSTSTGEMLP